MSMSKIRGGNGMFVNSDFYFPTIPIYSDAGPLGGCPWYKDNRRCYSSVDGHTAPTSTRSDTAGTCPTLAGENVPTQDAGGSVQTLTPAF